MKKTIFISIPYGMSGRNILRSEAFRILKDKFRIVVLSPLYADENFKIEFESDSVILRELPKRLSLLFRVYRKFLDAVEGYYFTRKTKIESLLILEQCLKRQKPLVYVFRSLIGALLGKRSSSVEVLRRLQKILINSNYYNNLFKEFSPCLVFLTHPIALEEAPLAFQAKQNGVRVVAMIHSWDNLTAKSGMRTVTSNKSGRMLPDKFDRVIVWNEIIRQELIDYYGYAPDEVFISGIPQFDFYFNHSFSLRESFFGRMGGDPKKKLILYAAGSPLLLPKQNEILEMLVKAISDNKFSEPCQLIIRAHPGSNMKSLKDRYCDNRNIFFDQPGIADSATSYSKGWKGNNEEQVNLAEVIYHSDVTVNIFSTMSLDAAVLDKPIVCVGFDGHENYSYYSSILKFYDFTHYKAIMKTGGVRLAKSIEELINYINEYLKDPGLDTQGRKRIREEQLFYLDGKSGRRIGEFISKIA